SIAIARDAEAESRTAPVSRSSESAGARESGLADSLVAVGESGRVSESDPSDAMESIDTDARESIDTDARESAASDDTESAASDDAESPLSASTEAGESPTPFRTLSVGTGGSVFVAAESAGRGREGSDRSGGRRSEERRVGTARRGWSW